MTVSFTKDNDQSLTVKDANGNWVSTGTVDQWGYTPDKLEEFKQDELLLPTTGTPAWDDRVPGHQQSWAEVGAPGSNQLFDDSVKNVIDKFVFVKNTGKGDAYIRTWFAFEQGDVAAEDFNKVIMKKEDPRNAPQAYRRHRSTCFYWNPMTVLKHKQNHYILRRIYE